MVLKKQPRIVLSEQQKQIQKAVVKGEKNVVAEALAGTGKTFQIERSIGGYTEANPRTKVGAVAFNRTIADELKKRLPAEVESRTTNSLGFAICREFGAGKKFENSKVRQAIYQLNSNYKYDRRLIRKSISPLDRLTSLAKANLLSPEELDQQQIELLVQHYGLLIDYDVKEVIYDYLPKILTRNKENVYEIDFNDQLWLPVVHGWIYETNYKFDLLCVDESQDLTKCQHNFLLALAKRFLFVGDRYQSIYGFRGADINSIPNLIATLQQTEIGTEILPLTKTRRCPKSHVELAKEIVSQFEALEDAKEGVIYEGDEAEIYERGRDGTLVICRTNAPLIKHCYGFIGNGVAAKIQGRNDVGNQLIDLIKSFEAISTSDLEGKIYKWEYEQRKKASEQYGEENSLIEIISDKAECIKIFIRNNKTNSVDGVITEIEKVFSEEENVKGGVLLSSIHKAKGLEAENVIFLHPEKVPHPLAKIGWQIQQEMNVKYVALTRSKYELNLLHGK